MQAGCSERLVVREFHACTRKANSGVLVQPSLADIFEWQVAFMPAVGFFASRILTFRIRFDNFPAAVPLVVFPRGVVHPQIDPASGRFDCAARFGEWNVRTRVHALIDYVCAALVAPVADPEAAFIVLTRFRCRTFIASWEFCCRSPLPWVR